MSVKSYEEMNAEQRMAFAAGARGSYPKGAVDQSIIALEAARPDTKEEGAVRRAVDDALDRLYRLREIEEGIVHPYRSDHA